jgi:Phospholipase_D-nuclease N-terminal
MIGSIVVGIFKLMFVLLSALLGVAGFAFWVWMLVHAITNKGLGDGEKIAWVLVIIFLPVLGCILYFLIGRPKGSVSVPA